MSQTNNTAVELLIRSVSHSRSDAQAAVPSIRDAQLSETTHGDNARKPSVGGETGDKTKTAGAQVSGTVELLEMILTHLPVKTLLLSQRVSKTWKTVIDNNASLQKALFFKPAVDGVAFFHEYSNFSELTRRFNLVKSNFFYLCPTADLDAALVYEKLRNSWQREPSQEQSAACEVIRKLRTTRVFLNPLLLEKFDWFREFFKDTAQAPGCFYKLDTEGDTDLIPCARRPEASWRRMLLTQPPLDGLLLNPRRSRIPQTSYGETHVAVTHLKFVIYHASFGTPLTMDGLRSMLQAWSQIPFCIQGTEKFEVWENPEERLEKLEKLGKLMLDRSTELSALANSSDDDA